MMVVEPFPSGNPTAFGVKPVVTVTKFAPPVKVVPEIATLDPNVKGAVVPI